MKPRTERDDAKRPQREPRRRRRRHPLLELLRELFSWLRWLPSFPLFALLAALPSAGCGEALDGAAAGTRSEAAVDGASDGGGEPAPTPARTAVPRAQRLARDKAAALARAGELERGDAAVVDREFAAALQGLVDEPSAKRFGRFGDDWLPKSAARGWLAWNGRESDAGLPLALRVEAQDHPFAVLVDLQQQLAAAGALLLFVPIPSRAELEPELLLPARAGATPLPPRVAATTRFLAKLAEAGVESVDLAPAFTAQRTDPDPRRTRLYLRGNNHWTPRGAELAAEQVAARLAEFEPAELAAVELPLPSHRFVEGRDFDVVRRLGQVRGEGIGQAEGAPSEAVGVNAVEWRAGGGPTAERARGSSIVLLGDSFAAMHKELHGSFVDQLVRFTGLPIDVIAPQGGAELACREALSRRDAPLAGKKVVIWLLPAPLLAPSGLWKRVAMGGG
ncbi:MAG: hypothetical protein JNL90_09625 [Planctomycetes bacterium]|nr:hypothetical protein [Planctomycetota bacterium]